MQQTTGVKPRRSKTFPVLKTGTGNQDSLQKKEEGSSFLNYILIEYKLSGGTFYKPGVFFNQYDTDCIGFSVEKKATVTKRKN